MSRVASRIGLLAAFVAIGTPTLVVAQVSPSAYTSATRYDAMGRVAGTIAPDPDGAGPLGYAAVRNSYDAIGRLTKVEAGQLSAWQSEGVTPASWTGFTISKTVDTVYDAVDHKLKESISAGGTVNAVTQYSYDLAGRLDCTAVRMNPAVYGSLPASACTQGTAGSNGPDRISRNIYDAAGQLLQVREGVGTPLERVEATYSYTANGKKEYVIDANGNRAQLVYDGFDRLSQWIFPSTTRPSAYDDSTQANALSSAGSVNTADYEQYGYDANGNRTSLRKRDGSTLTYSYDALNRMTVKVVPSRAGLTAAQTRDVYYDYDLRGLMTKALFDSLSGEGVSSSYNGFGELTSATTNMGGVTRSLSYTYDRDSKRLTVTHPDGQIFTYTRDGLDRIAGVYEGFSITTAAQLIQATFNSDGLVSAIKRSTGANGFNATFGYDGLNRLTSLANDAASTANDLTIGQGFSPASQIISQSRSNDAYAWTGAVAVNRTYTTNGLNQYTAAGPASFTYDPNGNLTSDGSANFVYDIENRLVSASGAKTAGLTYDPMGRLWKVTGTTTDTRFLYDGDELIAEYDSAGTMARRYVHSDNADDPVVQYDGAGVGAAARTFLMPDERGSIVGLIYDNGTSRAINAYDEYGIPGSANQGRFQYTGQAWLPELGMYHYKARIYSPTLGRFLQTDPIGYDDQVNLYAYVGDDPINSRDPTGQRTIFIGGAWDIKDPIIGGTRIVQQYSNIQMRDKAYQDVQYFSYRNISGIKNALNSPLGKGEPMVVVGHSLGGAMAVNLINSTGVKVDLLITIDPVSFQPTGRPKTVRQWVNVLAFADDKKFDDYIAIIGRLTLSGAYTNLNNGADVTRYSKRHHGDFEGMMDEIDAQARIDQAYADQNAEPFDR